jgi:hypothetical protein
VSEEDEFTLWDEARRVWLRDARAELTAVL